MDIDSLKHFGVFGVGISAIALLWGNIKSIFHKLFNLFIVEIDVHSKPCDALLSYLKYNAKKVSFGKKMYSGDVEYVKPIKRKMIIVWEVLARRDYQAYWIKDTLLFLKSTSGKDKNTDVNIEKGMKILFLRYTLDFKALIHESIEFFENEFKKSTQKFEVNVISMVNGGVYYSGGYPESAAPIVSEGSGQKYLSKDHKINRLLKWDSNEIGIDLDDRSRKFPNIFSLEGERLYKVIKTWKESELWYKEKGIQFRRGALVHGIGGSGKSFLIKKIAESLNLPLYLLDISTFENKSLIDTWSNLRGQSPNIVLIEDVDVVFNKRENVSKQSKLTFDCLLNCISGVNDSEGSFVIITTNDVTKLDDALGVPKGGHSTRSGRLDEMICLNYADEDQKRKIANHILVDYPSEITDILNVREELTASQFSDRCSELALKLHWRL